MEQEVTQNNFWQSHNAFEKESLRESWRLLKLQCSLSFAKNIIYRLIFSFIAMPSSLLFCIFLLESNSIGVLETINTIFVENPPITEKDTSLLVNIYSITGIVFFTISWVVSWKSPAQRRTELLMDRWWFIHGSKLPGLHEPK
jgi:hypothetical protein